eukprot:SAG31_NODE_15894_length_733_cov_1.072555_1_plen_91_part_01
MCFFFLKKKTTTTNTHLRPGSAGAFQLHPGIVGEAGPSSAASNPGPSSIGLQAVDGALQHCPTSSVPAAVVASGGCGGAACGARVPQAQAH